MIKWKSYLVLIERPTASVSLRASSALPLLSSSFALQLLLCSSATQAVEFGSHAVPYAYNTARKLFLRTTSNDDERHRMRSLVEWDQYGSVFYNILGQSKRRRPYFVTKPTKPDETERFGIHEYYQLSAPKTHNGSHSSRAPVLLSQSRT